MNSLGALGARKVLEGKARRHSEIAMQDNHGETAAAQGWAVPQDKIFCHKNYQEGCAVSSIIGSRRDVDFSERTACHRWCRVNGFLREDFIVWTRPWLKGLPEHNLEEEREI